MTYCAVIPTYNNARTVADIVRRTLAVCPKVIVVNDGSSDDTIQVLKPYSNEITLISYSRNRGKGHALRLGLGEFRLVFPCTADNAGQVETAVTDAFQFSDLAEHAANLTLRII